MQRQSIEHLLHILEEQQSRRALKDKPRYQQMIETARHGCRTLAWIERREELIRKIYALEAAEPLLAEILRAFPGAALREVLECP
jgi:hypothetical protein